MEEAMEAMKDNLVLIELQDQRQQLHTVITMLEEIQISINKGFEQLTENFQSIVNASKNEGTHRLDKFMMDLSSEIKTSISETFESEAACKVALKFFRKSITSDIDTKIARQIQAMQSSTQIVKKSLESYVESLSQSMIKKSELKFQEGLTELINGNQILFDSFNSTTAEAVKGVPLDSTAELLKLVVEGRFEEAFDSSLSLGGHTLDWLCNQMDFRLLLSHPSLLSQGVLYRLLNNLSESLEIRTSTKLDWMLCVALAIHPRDSPTAEDGSQMQIIIGVQEKLRTFITMNSTLPLQTLLCFSALNRVIYAILHDSNYLDNCGM